VEFFFGKINLTYQRIYKKIPADFPTVAKIKNNKKLAFKIPTIKVNKPPMIGIQANSKDQTSNLLNFLKEIFI
jgi:hypothetical protein|tara:strand:- start:186 stop:404 length:219 start_codon:yes stop_codon:yes gene_type:complete